MARFQEERDLHFRGYAGTSAGAIVAALAAVGYTARNPSLSPSSITKPDLNMVMERLDFEELLGAGPVPFNKLRVNIESFRSAFPRLVDAGKSLQQLASAGRLQQITTGRSLLQKYQTDLQTIQDLVELLTCISTNKGLYDTHALVNWLQPYLINSGAVDKGGRVTFDSVETVKKTSLKIVATDLMDPVPRVFGPMHSRNEDVVSAVQASISIPLFFFPFMVGKKLLVDGGLRSNYPLWIFDTERCQNGMLIPIIGFRLEQQYPDVHTESIFEDYMWGLINAALEGPSWLQGKDVEKLVEVTVTIPANIRGTSFDITNGEKELLFYKGYAAASATLRNEENRAILGLA